MDILGKYSVQTENMFKLKNVRNSRDVVSFPDFTSVYLSLNRPPLGSPRIHRIKNCALNDCIIGLVNDRRAPCDSVRLVGILHVIAVMLLLIISANLQQTGP